MMWRDGYLMGWGMWVLMVLGTVGFWVLVAVAVRVLLTGGAGSSADEPDPLRRLDDRLAKGQIDAQEHQYRRRLIIDGHLEYTPPQDRDSRHTTS